MSVRHSAHNCAGWNGLPSLCLTDHFDPTLAEARGANWSWFMTWHTSWVIEDNTPEHLNAAYNHGFAITMDDLASLR